MKKIKTSAFTLVELLVAITLLVILWTIAYIFVEGNIAGARDAKRDTDLTEMSNVLELYFTENGNFPKPSAGVDITYSGSAIAWTQGTFWASVGLEVKNFGADYPKDPLYDNEYTYSTTNQEKEYQLSAIHETFEEEEWIWDLVRYAIPQTHAASLETAFVVWDYNGFMVKAKDSTTEYFIASPSIIANDISNPDVLHIIWEQKLVYDQFFNLPHSYASYMDVDGGFNFNVTDPMIFSGSSDDLKVENILLDFNAKLKYIYATTPTESFDKYISVLEKDGLTSLKWFLTRKFKIQFRSYFNCKDILDDGASRGDGLYTIDPDGEAGEAPYEVYCDMTTQWGWWTRIGDNHVVNGNFAGGAWIVWADENTDDTNTIVPLTVPVDSNTHALHQTWNYSSYYKVGFTDPSILKPGYEVRMSLWRSDSSTPWATDVTLMGWKNTPWTLWTCATWNAYVPSCYFTNFNRKLAHAPNFWSGWILSDIDVSVKAPISTVTTSYLDGWVLFDGFVPSTNSSSYGWVNTYSNAEKTAIDTWVQAGGFLISTNNESQWDPLGEYYGMPTIQHGGSPVWTVQNIDHPLVNGAIGLNVDLRGRQLYGSYARASLWGTIRADDIVLARDFYAPFNPTVLLRKHGKWYILFIADDGMFLQMSWGNTFDAGDYETVFAANIMTYAIETAAGINPKEGYVFHNRIYYNDGTFSTNGEDTVLQSLTVDGKVWTKELTRHRIYKTPESFDWFIGLDANNNKDLYYTWIRLELYYR
jgi:prepilin-type N-terminal cleavage/methylation domain-containing protein